MRQSAVTLRRSRWALLRAEIRESFLMAMNALAAHKLRSALTLLGVLVGVFSIIVVMTAMRVLQANIERELSQLGTHTFSIQKWPVIHVGGREGWERVWRRKNISWQQVERLRQKVTLAQTVAVETRFRREAAISGFAETEPDVPLLGVSPETFAAKNWNVAHGRAIMPSDVDGARNVCVLGASLAKKLFPFGTGVGDKIKFGGINYAVVGVLEARGQTLGGDQDNFLAIPITTGLNRFGAHWRSLNILVQAPDARRFDDTIEHEAMNESAETRVILICDAWNPYLTEPERALVSAMLQAKGAFEMRAGGRAERFKRRFADGLVAICRRQLFQLAANGFAAVIQRG